MQATAMKGTVVARFDKYGPAFKIENGEDAIVYAQDKKLLPSFEGVIPGANVEFTSNGKWVHTITVTSPGNKANPSQFVPSGDKSAKTYNTSSWNAPNPEKDAAIARAVAVKLGFENAMISDMTGKASKEEVIQAGKDLTFMFERYLTSGSFDPKELA